MPKFHRFGAVKHGFAVQNVPHIFFLSYQKENVPDTVQKKKRLGMSWPTERPTHPYEKATGTNCRQYPEISYRLRR